MIRGLTHTIRITVPTDLSEVTECELWIRRSDDFRDTICKDMDELSIDADADESVISYTLSENESLNLTGNSVYLQCRWKYPDGTVSGMKRAEIRIDPALWKEAMK
jgi:hypothetical protein